MAFQATSTNKSGVGVIVLEGELDSVSAPVFRAEVERVTTGNDLVNLVLDMTNLSYLSSAGLRGLVFARQKMPDDVAITLVGVGSAVEQTIRLVGFHHSVAFSDAIPEAS
jgi:anti-anti-sigma factor